MASVLPHRTEGSRRVPLSVGRNWASSSGSPAGVASCSAPGSHEVALLDPPAQPQRPRPASPLRLPGAWLIPAIPWRPPLPGPATGLTWATQGSPLFGSGCGDPQLPVCKSLGPFPNTSSSGLRTRPSAVSPCVASSLEVQEEPWRFRCRSPERGESQIALTV